MSRFTDLIANEINKIDLTELEDKEQRADVLLLNLLNQAMGERLAEQKRKGKHGWYDPKSCTQQELMDMMCSNCMGNDFLDVAILAGMIYARGQMEKIAPRIVESIEAADEIAIVNDDEGISG
jgi:hypothetical protein